MKVVIGVDSGGSTTRALAVTLDGERVAYAEGGGGNPSHDDASRENVRRVVERITEVCGAENVVRLVAGIAGFDRPEHEARVNEATQVKGLTGVRQHVNDAEVAHFGAFEGGHGIVTIQGTGSMIFAVLENGRRVKNGDFFHYAPAGAVRLGMRTVFSLLASDTFSDDPALVAEVLNLWEVATLTELREAMTHLRELTPHESSYRFGMVARHCTRSAQEGFALASDLCRSAAADIAEGIRLLGPLFDSDEVPVALIGACVKSAPVRQALSRRLGGAKEKRYRIVEAARPPVVGAVLMALQAEGVSLDPVVIGRLGEG